MHRPASVRPPDGPCGSARGQLVRTQCGRSHLTTRQFAVLQAVYEANGQSQTAIMAATGIDRSSTADLVRQLASNRWLQRRRTRRDALLSSMPCGLPQKAGEPGPWASLRLVQRMRLFCRVFRRSTIHFSGSACRRAQPSKEKHLPGAESWATETHSASKLCDASRQKCGMSTTARPP